MLIECKFIRTNANELIGKVLTQIKRARKQPRNANEPFVIAVGVRGRADAAVVDQLVKEISAQIHWFQDRPNVSAVLVFLELAPEMTTKEVFRIDMLPARPFIEGNVIEMVNLEATRPIPSGFSFQRFHAKGPG